MKDMYVGDTGKGFPLVLVHGFLGSSKMWGPQVKFFKKNFRVVTPDLPGFGKSKKMKSCKSIKIMADLILKCLKEKKIERYNLLGHSMGGMIAQEMAKKDGKNISKLIFYSTGAIGDMPGRFETIHQSRKILKEKGLIIIAKKIAKTWFVKEEKAKYFDICIKAGKQTSIKATDNALIAFQNWNGVNALKNIKNKTLIVWGDKDKSYDKKQIQILKKKITNSSLVIFNGCAHNVHLEKVNEFNNKINKFLEDSNL